MKTQLFAKRLLLACLAIPLIAGVLSSPAWAQVTEEELSDNLQRAQTILAELDRLAATCLQARKNVDNTLDSEQACQQFHTALNGETLAAYLESCAIARTWREAFVDSQVDNDTTGADGDQARQLSNLVNTEYLCGTDALTRRTEFVEQAYRLTASNRNAARSLANSLQYQIDSDRQSVLMERERSRLLQSLSSQRSRNLQQTRRQFDDLELELLRQQTSPVYPR